MNVNEIASLRKYQFIWLNASMTVMYFMIMMAMELGVTMRIFYIGLTALLLVQIIATIKNKQPLLYTFSTKMRTLMLYEREKMGTEWKAQQKVNAILQSFLIIMFLFQAWMMGNQPFYIEGEFLYYVYIYIFTVFLVNISTFIHNRKVDKSTAEEMKGYTKKMLLFSVLFTVIFFIAGISMGFFVSYLF